MNTNKLARHYPALSAAERLSLMLAAAARGDDREHTRLVAAAPRLSYQLPDTFGRGLAFVITAAISRMERLDLAALYFKASAVAEAAEGAVAARCRGAARLFGYLVRVQAEGWALFCKRNRFDPAVCEKGLPGEFVLQQSAVEAAEDGFSPEAALEYARRMESSPTPKTAGSVADELQALYLRWVEQWE